MINVAGIVKQFYNTTPFPDYELKRFDDKEDVILQSSDFAKLIDRSIPEKATIIDIGTGTGQLSALLSLRRKFVMGVDFSQSSLNKAKSLKKKLNLNNLQLEDLDILNEEQVLKIGKKFDYVLCLGVLHHTENPYLGFKNALKLLKPGGKIAIGLYNKYGRIPLKIRKFLSKKFFPNNIKIKNFFIKLQLKDISDKEKLRGWWNDQYLHPHESTHTVGEVLKWFKKNDIKFLQSVPSLKFLDQSNTEIAGLWNDTDQRHPNLIVRIYNQIKWIYTTHHEGGYWVMFGELKK